jgi:hypothetical protein
MRDVIAVMLQAVAPSSTILYILSRLLQVRDPTAYDPGLFLPLGVSGVGGSQPGSGVEAGLVMLAGSVQIPGRSRHVAELAAADK